MPPAATTARPRAASPWNRAARYTAWHARHHVAQLGLSGLTPERYEDIVALRRATGALFRDVVARGVSDGSFAVTEVAPVVRAMLPLGIDPCAGTGSRTATRPEQLSRLYAQLAVRIVTRSASGRYW